MPTFSKAKVTIYDSVIRSHFAPGGIVYDNAASVARAAGNEARALAPVKTGKLKASIKSVPRGAPGAYGASFTTYANVRYGIFVEEGTGPLIHARGGRWMRIPRAVFGAAPSAISAGRLRAITAGRFQAGDNEFYFKQAVRGQEPVHYIKRGVNAALTSHGYPAIA